MDSSHFPAFSSLSSVPTTRRFPLSSSSPSASPFLFTGRATDSAVSASSFCLTPRSSVFRPRPVGMFVSKRPKVSCPISMMNGESDGSTKLNLNDMMDTARKYQDKLPQPIKSFPWNRGLHNFIQIILDLFTSVTKYLSVPLLMITSLSEMTYCAYERKLLLVPIPLILGFALGGILKETALELSPRLKDAEVPWHLIAIAIFFTLLKFPGPYYPYWGRILIPHFANGGLLRTLWLMYLWYKRPQKGGQYLDPILH